MNLRLRPGAARTLYWLVSLVLALCLIPTFSRKLRGVDAEGHPVVMEIRDAAVEKWFAPDGRALLFWSRERDGSLRFWNRPGYTPDTKVLVMAVTRTQRIEWEHRMEVEKAERARRAMLVAEREPQVIPTAGMLHNEPGFIMPAHHNVEAPVLPQRSTAVSHAQPVYHEEKAWMAKRIYPGMFFQLPGNGSDALEIQSDGKGFLEVNGRPPVHFGPGASTFEASGSGCRIHCRQNEPLELRYRWITME